MNELRWWSKWATLRRHGDGYLISSDELRESFFNRAGSFSCQGLAGTAAWAERHFSPRGMNPTVLAFESCSADPLLAAGYRKVDEMTVLRSTRTIPDAGAHHLVLSSSDPRAWTLAYLRSFYGNGKLAKVVEPKVTSLMESREVTLLEARLGEETAGVCALFRTRGIAGVYCIGTVPKFRRRGVATALLSTARKMADSEGRALILQTLTSERAMAFYLARGFARVHSKLVLEKKAQMTSDGSFRDAGYDVKINRKMKVGKHPFANVFVGFERVEAVRRIFGKRTNNVLNNLQVEVMRRRGYMKINDEIGSIVVNSKYLKTGRRVDIYLDVIHELVHIRQHMEGKELWDRRYEYIDRPTEIEAYRVAVKEARRLGMDEKQVAQYLKVEWISDEAFERFLKNCGVKLET